MVQGVFAWLVFPFLGLLLAIPPGHSFAELFAGVKALDVGMTMLFGVLWGVGGLTFGLSMRYLGVALGQSISLGTCAGLGTILAPVMLNVFYPEAHHLEKLTAAVLIGVAVTHGHHDVMLFSNAGKCVRFAEDALRAMGRNAHGVRGMRLDEGQKLVSLIVTDSDTSYVLTATENGYGKRTLVSEYPRHGRGTKGLISISTSERNGQVVSAALVTDDDDIMILSTGGKVVRTRAEEVSIYSRPAQGVRLINLGEDTLASIRRAVRTDENEEVEHLEIEVPEDAGVPADFHEEEEADEEPLDDIEGDDDTEEDNEDK